MAGSARAPDEVFDGGVAAVDDVSLDIGDGEFLVLVGPSGCGKTTLLRMIAGLEDVTDGVISIGGADVTDLAPRRRDIAMVFQSYALYPHMSVRQNLALRPQGRGGRRRTRSPAGVDEVAKLLGLGDLLERKPAQLSGGQRQRVAMGRAIVREPQAFLMDEPLSNLDAKLRVGMRASLAAAPQPARRHHRLRHARPDRGDDARAARGGHARRAHPPGRRAAAAVPAAARPLRGGVHRLAGDEPRRGDTSTAAPSLFGRFRVPLDPAAGAAGRVERPRRARHPARELRGRRLRARRPARARGDVEVLEELGSDAHVFFHVDAPRITAGDAGGERGRGDAARRRGARSFTARVDPRTQRPA